MMESCERLAGHVRENLAPSSGITGLKVHETHGFVSFRWYERDFVVKRSLEVFEVKGQNLFVTGASILLQAVLSKAELDAKIVGTVISSILEVENLLGEDAQRDSGFRLLGTVRDTLKRLSHRKPDALTAGMPSTDASPVKGSWASSKEPMEPAVAE